MPASWGPYYSNRHFVTTKSVTRRCRMPPKVFNELKNPPAEGVESKSHSVVIVARRLDGQVSVTANKDGMSASATVTAPYGSKPITETQVLNALKGAGVVKGIDY